MAKVLVQMEADQEGHFHTLLAVAGAIAFLVSLMIVGMRARIDMGEQVLLLTHKRHMGAHAHIET